MHHRSLRLLASLAIATLVMGACTTDGGPAGPLQVQAGVNDPEDVTIAVLSFLPAEFTVAPGDEVEWSFPGPEPHSVTFFPEGETPPSPDTAGEYFASVGDTGTVDGATLVNSGLRPFGPEPAGTFTVTFPDAGAYGYVCVIHPQMAGVVTVADEGAHSQADVDTAAAALEEEYLAEGRAAKAALVDAEPRSEAANGATTWYVEMGSTTAHTDVLAFAPAPVEIAAGDTVVFINNSGAPHTASFAGETELPLDPESEEAMTPVEGPLNATAFFNTGWLPPNAPPGAGPPEEVRSFAFEVPEAGTYDYVCLLHVPSGMVGSITAT